MCKQLFGAIIAMHILQIAHIAQSFFSLTLALSRDTIIAATVYAANYSL
jgi:hypothetical protein